MVTFAAGWDSLGHAGPDCRAGGPDRAGQDHDERKAADRSVHRLFGHFQLRPEGAGSTRPCPVNRKPVASRALPMGILAHITNAVCWAAFFRGSKTDLRA